MGNIKTALIQYYANDGNDLIQGFSAFSTLQLLTDDNIVMSSNGKDILLIVGKNIITLQGAATLENIKIIDKNGDAIPFTTASAGDDLLLEPVFIKVKK